MCTAEQSTYCRVYQLLDFLLNHSTLVGKLGEIRYTQFKLETWAQ